MLNTIKIFLTSLCLLLIFKVEANASFYQDTLQDLEPKPEHAHALYVSLNLLEQYHYRKLKLSDSISSIMFDNYMSTLDRSKAFFLKSDVEYFEKYRYQLDDELRAGKLDFGYQLFELFRERALERYNYIQYSKKHL